MSLRLSFAQCVCVSGKKSGKKFLSEKLVFPDISQHDLIILSAGEKECGKMHFLILDSIFWCLYEKHQVKMKKYISSLFCLGETSSAKFPIFILFNRKLNLFQHFCNRCLLNPNYQINAKQKKTVQVGQNYGISRLGLSARKKEQMMPKSFRKYFQIDFI